MSGSKDRVRKELDELSKADGSGVSAAPIGGDLTHLRGSITGPADTPYAGGTWGLDITLPRNYPFEPPKIKFLTPVWHPNVSSQTGAICLDILKDAWSPALTVKTALLSLQALLCAPEPSDPQDAEVAGQYVRDRKAWEATARFWTQSYATTGGSGAAPPPPGSGAAGAGAAAPPQPPPLPPGTRPEEAEKVRSMMAMGFEGVRSLAALRSRGGNLDSALESLLG